MLTSFPVCVLLGTALGFLSGLGTGGGSLLILYLTLVLGMDSAQARTINLMFFLPAAVLSTALRWKQGHLNIKKLLPGILAGSSMAGVCTLFASQWNTEFMKTLFGILLIATGIRELLYKPK